MAFNGEGVRLQIMQEDPDDFVSNLVGVQMSFSNALALAQGIQEAMKVYGERTGTIMPKPDVEIGFDT